jgi:arylsulfatase A-like enzyme
MWLAFNAPHSPFHKPPDSLHTVQGLTGTTAHINQNPKLYFKAMTEAMDTEIGRLFRYLASIGRLENTQIIFIGDNGNAAQTAQLAADANRVKGTLYEGGIRVPLIIAGSQVVQPNRVSAALTGTVDLYATILEMAGFQNWLDYIPSVKKPVDAKSLMSVLKNQNTGSRTWTFSEQFSAASQAVEGKTIRNAVFKLIRFDNGQQAFYNLMTDPTERTNLLSRNLSSLERENYTFLCNELSLLVGTNRCLNVPTSDLADLGVKVSPTLFSESLFVETPDVFDYQLMDISGKVQLSGRRQGRTKISTQALPIGTYLLTVKTHRGGGSVKVVKVVGY